jgi:hypothetical protein
MEKKSWLFLIVAVILAVVIAILVTGTGPTILSMLSDFAATTGVAIINAPFLLGLSNIWAGVGLWALAVIGMPLVMWGLYKVALHKVTDKIRGINKAPTPQYNNAPMVSQPSIATPISSVPIITQTPTPTIQPVENKVTQ